MNEIFQDYKKLEDKIRKFKIGVAQVSNGKIVQAEVIEPEVEEVITIQAYDNDEYTEYLKARRERELEKFKTRGEER